MLGSLAGDGGATAGCAGGAGACGSGALNTLAGAEVVGAGRAGTGTATSSSSSSSKMALNRSIAGRSLKAKSSAALVSIVPPGGAAAAGGAAIPSCGLPPNGAPAGALPPPPVATEPGTAMIMWEAAVAVSACALADAVVVETLNRLQSKRAGSHGTLLRTGRTATRFSLASPLSFAWLACSSCKQNQDKRNTRHRSAQRPRTSHPTPTPTRCARQARTANCAMVSADCRPTGGASFSMIVDVDAVVNRLAMDDDSGWKRDAARKNSDSSRTGMFCGGCAHIISSFMTKAPKDCVLLLSSRTYRPNSLLGLGVPCQVGLVARLLGRVGAERHEALQRAACNVRLEHRRLCVRDDGDRILVQHRRTLAAHRSTQIAPRWCTFVQIRTRFERGSALGRDRAVLYLVRGGVDGIAGCDGLGGRRSFLAPAMVGIVRGGYLWRCKPAEGGGGGG